MSSFYGERHLIEADRARQAERAKQERIAASAVRDRLEKQAGRGLPRAGLGLALAKIEAADRAASGDVSATLDALRKLAGRSDGPDNSTMRAPSFETGSRSRFDHESASDFPPALRAGQVSDAEGSINSDARTERDHFASGEPSDAMTVLSVEDLHHVLSMRTRNRFF